MEKYTVRKKVFKNIFLLSAIIIILFSSLFAFIFYSSEINHANKILKQRNLVITYFISSYFTKFYQNIELLSKNRKVILGAWLDNEERIDVLQLYDIIQKNDPDINYVYSGYINKYLLINDYIPPPGYDPTIRPWYVAAIKSAPKVSNGIPYREIKTKELLISISKVLIDSNKQITGVIAIDTAINKIENILKEKFGSYRTSRSYIFKKNGEILLCNQKKFLGFNFQQLIKSKNFNNNYLNNIDGSFSFIQNNKERLAYYHYMEQIGWIILTTIDKDEILYPILEKIFTVSLFILLITIFLGWVFSISLSSEIVIPLNNLTNRIKNIINGDTSEKTDYKYPPNEIGEIAEYIDNLTSKALYQKNIELVKLNKELKKLSAIDPLTNLFNRRVMDEKLSKEWQRAVRYKSKFALIIFDIDHFKKINDTYGHQTGDKVLREISRLSEQVLRKADVIARWGGEEFLILLPETDKKGAEILAEKLRKKVEQYRFTDCNNVTISLGVSVFYDEKTTVNELLNKADKNLYIAKQSGRNRVVA